MRKSPRVCTITNTTNDVKAKCSWPINLCIWLITKNLYEAASVLLGGQKHLDINESSDPHVNTRMHPTRLPILKVIKVQPSPSIFAYQKLTAGREALGRRLHALFYYIQLKLVISYLYSQFQALLLTTELLYSHASFSGANRLDFFKTNSQRDQWELVWPEFSLQLLCVTDGTLRNDNT